VGGTGAGRTGITGGVGVGRTGMTGSTGGTGELIYDEDGCGVIGINDGAGTVAYAGSWKAAC
jgi:hypothetical protein